MSADSQHILIVGAGIGGLTAALGLQRAGIPVTVLEQATQMRELGAGVSLAPNATRSLASLGVLDAVRDRGHVPDRGCIKHYESGEILSGYEIGGSMERRWGGPYIQIHRAELHRTLCDAVSEMDANAVRFGARVTGFSQDDAGVAVQVGADKVRGTCLIAADGVRSQIRNQLHGDYAPHFLGYVAWRCVLPSESLSCPLMPDTAVFIGPRKSLLRYKLGDGSLNVVAFARHESWAAEGWSIPADPAEIKATFAGWAGEAEALVQAMCRAGAFKWGLFGRSPLAAWQKGRVTLIGDAAHPMLPFLGQGAAMAIEDGVLLARAFAAADDTQDALAMYERTRYQRTMTTVARADAQGLKFHGHIQEGGAVSEVPMEDFGEFTFDAATVALSH